MNQGEETQGVKGVPWPFNHDPLAHKRITHPITMRELKLYAEAVKNPGFKLILRKTGGYGEKPKWAVSSLSIMSGYDIVKIGSLKYGFLLLTQRGREKKYASVDAVVSDFGPDKFHAGLQLTFSGFHIC